MNSIMKTFKIMPILVVFITCFFYSCSHTEDSLDPIVDVNNITINGEAQTFSVKIRTNENWKITSDSWLECSDTEGVGAQTIVVKVEDNYFRDRGGTIIVSSPNEKVSISVKQSSIYTSNPEWVHLRTSKGYNDTYSIYGEYQKLSLSSGINSKYLDNIEKYEEEYNNMVYPIKSYYDMSQDYSCRYMIPGLRLDVNDKLFANNLSMIISELYVDESERKDLSYYQGISRLAYFEDLKDCYLDYSMLAPQTGTPQIGYDKIRFSIDFQKKDSELQYHLGYSDVLNGWLEARWLLLDYSVLNFSMPNSLPEIGKYEYSLTYERFNGKQFLDDDGNLYCFKFSVKKLTDITSISFNYPEHLWIYPFSKNSTYPIITIEKNGKTWYEVINWMFTEGLGTASNISKEGYCCGFEGCIGLKEWVYIDFGSGFDEDSNPWYKLGVEICNDYNDGYFRDCHYTSLKLHPLSEEDAKGILGVFEN